MYSRILKHSYTAEEYIEWIPAKKCNKKNKPSNKRFSEWFCDMFLEIFVPPKKYYKDEQVNQYIKMSQLNSPVNGNFFINLCTHIKYLNNYPIHLVIDFIDFIL